MSDEICKCSHPKEFHRSFLKEMPCDYDGKCVGGCQKFEPVGSDRHPKWQRVKPGTVIPAGQPYRTEWSDPSGDSANERVSPFQQTVPPSPDWFIDSSWKPPLVLPTTPTWGIAVHAQHGVVVGRFWLDGDEVWQDLSSRRTSYRRHSILDFIPYTDEQVQRIEAAR